MSMEEDLLSQNPCSNSSNVNGGVSSSVATTMDDDTAALYSLHNPSSPSAVSSVNDNGDFDRVLFQNLVDMVPLVESLMDRRATTSFTRRGSMIYTKTPKDLNSKKNADLKGRKAAQVTSTKVRKDAGSNALDTTSRKDARGGSVEEHSFLKSMSLKEMEELLLLRVQVEELQKKLLEKDKALSSAEESLKQLTFCREVEVLKRQIEEKESQLRSARLQISDAKIRVADRQAIAEKAQWEAKISNRKAEEVQKEIDYLNHEINLFMQLFDSCKTNEQKEDGASQEEDQDSCEGSQILCTPLEESEIEKIEEAKRRYWSAIAAAKQKDNEESLFSASEVRSQLQSFLSREYNYQADMGKYVKLLQGLSYHPAEGLSH